MYLTGIILFKLKEFVMESKKVNTASTILTQLLTGKEKI